MTGRWQDLDPPGRRVAGAVFAALDGARLLADAHGSGDFNGRDAARPSISAVWAALVGGHPLPPGLVPDADFEALLAQAAALVVPRTAAAATRPDRIDGGVDRQAEGGQVQVVPSRGGPGQSYMTVTFLDPDLAATRLFAVTDDSAPVQVDLPAPVAGSIQLLLDNSDPILVALTDPNSRLYFV